MNSHKMDIDMPIEMIYKDGCGPNTSGSEVSSNLSDQSWLGRYHLINRDSGSRLGIDVLSNGASLVILCLLTVPGLATGLSKST